MDEESTIKLGLRMTRGRQPLQGAVVGATGAEEPFRGWLELVAALERARSGPVDEAGTRGEVTACGS